MKITFTDNMNVAHILPKLTPALSRRFDEIAAIENADENMHAQYECMVELIGEESASKCFDAENYEDCDLVAVCLCYKRATTAYQAVLLNDQLNQTRRTIDQIPVDKIGKIVGINGGK